MPIKICLVTVARSDYDRLYWLVKDLSADSDLDLQIVVTGMHLSERFGHTVDQIEKDGFMIAEKVDMGLASDRKEDITKAIGSGVCGVTEALEQLAPDLVLIYGDRFELLAIAVACVGLQIPLGHIGGGQLTQGAIDDQVRHMITKASHFHFVANPIFARRLAQMGEEPWRICVSGSPAIDCMSRLDLLSEAELDAQLGLMDLDQTALVTFHPETYDLKNTSHHVSSLIEALLEGHRRYGLRYILTYPNADAENEKIIEAIERLARDFPAFVRLFKNLGQLHYASILSKVKMVIGNSSSGIVEAPFFNVPAVNIGLRQQGRVFAENVIQVYCRKESIIDGIRQAMEYDRPECASPYGRSDTSFKIMTFIKGHFQQKSRTEILVKKFSDWDPLKALTSSEALYS